MTASRSSPPVVDPGAIPYAPSLMDLEGCDGLTLAVDRRWEHSVDRDVEDDGTVDYRHRFGFAGRHHDRIGPISGGVRVNEFIVNPTLLISFGCSEFIESSWSGGRYFNHLIDRISTRNRELRLDPESRAHQISNNFTLHYRFFEKSTPGDHNSHLAGLYSSGRYENQWISIFIHLGNRTAANQPGPPLRAGSTVTLGPHSFIVSEDAVQDESGEAVYGLRSAEENFDFAEQLIKSITITP